MINTTSERERDLQKYLESNRDLVNTSQTLLSLSHWIHTAEEEKVSLVNQHRFKVNYVCTMFAVSGASEDGVVDPG